MTDSIVCHNHFPTIRRYSQLGQLPMTHKRSTEFKVTSRWAKSCPSGTLVVSSRQFDELASRGDLVDYMASCGYIFEGLLQTREGVCMYDVTYDEDGEIEKYGYELTRGLATA